MVASADGKVVVDGRAAPLSSEPDRELFHHLRTQADAVMAGAGTVRSERYGRLVRRPELRAKREREGLAADPLAIVASASVALSAELPLFQAPEQRVLVVTDAPDAEVDGEPRAGVGYVREPDLAAAMRALRAEHGVRSILCEGGPTLNRALLAAGLVDELFLTLSPQVVGGAHPLTAVAGTPLDEPARLDIVTVHEAGGELFLRYAVRA
jgi:riboflavin-specific deaminase-like protein